MVILGGGGVTTSGSGVSTIVGFAGGVSTMTGFRGGIMSGRARSTGAGFCLTATVYLRVQKDTQRHRMAMYPHTRL